MSGPKIANAFWQQTMLRIKDPKVSVKFYKEMFGMTLVDEYHFEEMKFSLYFLATLPKEEVEKVNAFKPGTKEAHQYLWNMKHTTLELTHNHGDDTFQANNGNVEPYRGFGHIAFNTDDVYKVSEELEAAGVAFQKRPDEGNMKGLAFAKDPDGYWVELIRRSKDAKIAQKYNLSQTMIRVKDAKKSLKFYQDYFGMSLVAEKHFPQWKFSLYFLTSLVEGGEGGPKEGVSLESDEAFEALKGRYGPVLELTHNHGTEDDESFSYHDGNTNPKGFGHIGFLVDDIYQTCDILEAEGVPSIKKPDAGKIKGIAFVKDPNGYWVELIPRGWDL